MDDPMDRPDPYESLLALCQNRHSARSFLAQPLTSEQIEKIRTIAMTSPYASGKKNWELLVVTEKETIARMAETVRAQTEILAAKMRPDFADGFTAYAKNFGAFAEAPVLFIPCFRAAPSLSLMLDSEEEGIRAWERDNYVKSIACVGMLILLAAESLGLAGCYMTGPLLAEKALGPLINLKPGRSISALIPIGYEKTGDVCGKTGN